MSLTWNGGSAQKLVIAIAMEGLWLIGEDTVREATNDIPLDTGTLRRSSAVTAGDLPDPETAYAEAKAGTHQGKKPRRSYSEKRTIFVSYSTPYATRLHEDLTWKPRNWKYNTKGKRIPKPAVGGPKWLERALVKTWARRDRMFARARKKIEGSR